MVKEIIFDFDGTISDSFEVIMSIFAKYKSDLGFDKFDKEEIKIYKTKGAEELLKKSKVSMLKITKVINEMRKEANETMLKAKPFVGMVPLLNKLKSKGLNLGIMSTNGDKTINRFLENNNITVFDYVVGKGGLLGKDKVIKAILKKRNLKATEVLYVGDEVRDIQACKKIGIKIIAVTWGFNDEKILKEANPDFLIKKPEDILKIL